MPNEELKIGISISENPDLAQLGLGKMHLDDAMVEFARYILARGMTLVYGGDLRKDGFTRILFDLVETYNQSNTQQFKPIENFLAWPLHLDLITKEEADLEEIAQLYKLEPPKDIDKPNDIDKSKIIESKLPEHCYIVARCLTFMREKMNRATDARLILGGATHNFKGKYPGVIEEAYLALRDKKPLFLMGGFGGCARAIIQALHGKQPTIMTELSQSKNNNGYSEFIKYYNDHIQNLSDTDKQEPINYEELVNFFQKKGITGLNNGLSEEENERLFETIYLPEMISLVLKGLAKI